MGLLLSTDHIQQQMTTIQSSIHDYVEQTRIVGYKVNMTDAIGEKIKLMARWLGVFRMYGPIDRRYMQASQPLMNHKAKVSKEVRRVKGVSCTVTLLHKELKGEGRMQRSDLLVFAAISSRVRNQKNISSLSGKRRMWYSDDGVSIREQHEQVIGKP